MTLAYASQHPADAGPYPTLIALHGWGANALDLLGLSPHLCDGRLLVLCPQGPLSVPSGPGASGYGWFPISMGAPPEPRLFAMALDALDEFIDQSLERYPIASDRVALLGFSQGGAMAYALAARSPGRFAALAALSTWLPDGVVPSPAPGSPQLFAGMPVLVQHGESDPVIPVSRARAAVEVLRRSGADVRYREYGIGHQISADSLRDLNAFLVERLAGRRRV